MCRTRFLELVSTNASKQMATLNNFNLETYGDGDAIHNMVYGTGSLHGGSITGSGNIFLEKGNIEGVAIHTGSRMNITVNGNVTSVGVLSTKACVVGTHDMCISAGGFNSATGGGSSADGFGVLNVTGKLEVTNGGGGAIVKHSNGGGIFTIESEQSLVASYGGSTLSLLCAHRKGKSACKEVASVSLPMFDEEKEDRVEVAESLKWECGKACSISAAGGAEGTLFVVRKTA